MFKNFSMKATKKHERTTAITVLTSTELLIRELNYCTFQFFGKQNINAILCFVGMSLYYILFPGLLMYNLIFLFVFEIFLSILLYKLLKTMISFSSNLGYLYTIIYIMIYNFECCIYTFFIYFNFRLWQGTETLFPS